MSFFKKKCSNKTVHMKNVYENVELALNANAGAGNFKWEDMDAGTRQGKLVELMEKNEFDLNCAYKNPKNKEIIDNIREKITIDSDSVMDLTPEIVYIGVIALFIKSKEKPPALKKEGASRNLMAKLGGRRRRRTKKRKSRRRRKRTKKKRRRKSRRKKSRRRRR